MKMTITNTVNDKRIKNKPTVKMICDLMNQKVNSNTFFQVNDGEIVCESCDIMDEHCKIIALITLWMCGKQSPKQRRNYVAIGYGRGARFVVDDVLVELWQFLNTFKSMNDINVKIEF